MARDLLESWVHISDGPAGIGDNNGVNSRFNRGGKTGALLLHPFSRLPYFRVAEFALDGGDKPLEISFQNVIVRPRPHRFNGDVFTDIARDDDERKVKAALFERGQGVKAGEPRHHVV